METITVKASRQYDVIIGRGIDSLGENLAKVKPGGKIGLITDKTVMGLYGGRAQSSLQRAGYETHVHLIAGGEGCKSLQGYGQALNFLCGAGLSRQDTVVALGGGVVGDLAGFAAATYLRGIDVAQVPTTLLAAVDSSVGGKTAINLPQGKNLAGAFCQPVMVLCFMEIFDELPREIFAQGMAEVIKCGILGDKKLFELVEGGRGSFAVDKAVTGAVRLKAGLVERDELDRGERAALNLGHTAAHAIEKLSHNAISHGEAVAMGIGRITQGAVKHGMLEEAAARRILKALENNGLLSRCPYTPEELAAQVKFDKKRKGGQVELIVPTDIGKCVILPVGMETISSWL